MGVGVVGAVWVALGLTSTPSGMVLRSLLVPAECCSSSSTARRRPRQRRAFGGSGLILGGRRMGASVTRSVVERLSLRLGVMMPGFSRCEATAWTLREDADAGSSMPSLWAALILRRKSGASDDPRESIESMRVGDDVLGESGIVLPRDNVRDTSSDSPISIGDSCWTFSSRTVSIVAVTAWTGVSCAGARSGCCRSRSQSTVAQRATRRRVVSSTSSKWRIFSCSASFP